MPVNVGKSLDIGADTAAILSDLTMELNAQGKVDGKLELANVSGGTFTVNENGEVTVRYIGDKHHVPEELQFSYKESYQPKK